MTGLLYGALARKTAMKMREYDRYRPTAARARGCRRGMRCRKTCQRFPRKSAAGPTANGKSQSSATLASLRDVGDVYDPRPGDIPLGQKPSLKQTFVAVARPMLKAGDTK